MPDTEVVDVPERSRYELRLAGEQIGAAAYRRKENRIVLFHTQVDAQHQRRGYGSLLARAALEDAGRRGAEVVPLCPFIAWYIGEHPEYERLIAAGYATSQ